MSVSPDRDPNDELEVPLEGFLVEAQFLNSVCPHNEEMNDDH